jgi:hypothetical protein
LSSLLDDIPSLIIGPSQNFGVLSEAFHSDELLTQALSYHKHHELVTQFRLLRYGSQACANGLEQFLKVIKKIVHNTHITLNKCLFFLHYGEVLREFKYLVTIVKLFHLRPFWKKKFFFQKCYTSTKKILASQPSNMLQISHFK